MESSATTFAGNLSLSHNNFEKVARIERPSISQSTPITLATAILTDIMKFRRTTVSNGSCSSPTCSACLAPHLQAVVTAITERQPITFVIPAFPGKSPNPAKVLGPLPDLAEQRALQFLNHLCSRVERFYTYGAQVIVCSDGRVFSDVVGMREEDVTDYQDELGRMIEELGGANVTTFNLDNWGEGQDAVQLRHELMEKFGQSEESLKEKVRRGSARSNNPSDSEAHRIYCGITRFLFEDALHPGQSKSRTAIQNDCKRRAYEVIRRSNAWSALIEERFPHAVRLSIHPQTCGSTKLGIRLLDNESWMTPWHGVAVDTGEGFVLMKRWEAEKLEAQLVRDSKGRPSHFKIIRQIDNVEV